MRKGLLKCRGYIFNFLENPGIPPDNNASERGIRKLKIKQKIPGTFRSDNGADVFLTIHSISDTAQKNYQSQLNAISAILSLQDGRWHMAITEQLRRPMLTVTYGRRRIGKSELIKHVLTSQDVYHLSEGAQTQQQIDSFAKTASFTFDGFDRVPCHDWETILASINLCVGENTSVCLDEFSYPIRGDPSPLSITQRLVNNKKLKYNLILCSSSQLTMHLLVLNEKSPLYQCCAWQLKLKQLRLPYIKKALHCFDQQAVEEYTVWGGAPRYWELRADSDNLEEAVRNLLVNNYGTLYDELTRLLRDEHRDTVTSFLLPTTVDNGVNCISEIAGRMQQPATNLSQPISTLIDLGYVKKDIPFGDDPKSSKKGLYRLGDNPLPFYYRLINPNKYLIKLNRQDLVMDIVRKDFNTYAGQIWERTRRNFVTGNEINGVVYGNASRW